MSDKLNRREMLSCAGCVVALGCAAGAAKGQNQKGKKTDPGSYCGIYCESCGLYMMSKSQTDPAKVQCLGCKSNKLAPHCQNCPIKACAAAKGIQSCGECKAFPCDKTRKFHSSGKDFALVAEMNCYTLTGLDYDQWLKAQKTRWTCPKCGEFLSNRTEKCPKCGKDIYSMKEEAQAYKRFRKGE